MNKHPRNRPGIRAPSWCLAPQAAAALLLLVGSAAPTGAQEAATTQARPLEIADMFQIKRVGSPVVSPDGGWVAFTVGTPSTPTKSGSTQIWMVAADG
ncbi:MAG: hypothetical protein ACWGSQ_20590, partial [Longimicrobiales bacterium]